MVFYYISMIEDDADRNLATQLYHTYKQVIFKRALTFLKNETRAEDAVCDVLEHICKNITVFRGLGCNETRALIVVYSRNTCLNILKRDKIITFEELGEDTTAADDALEDLVVDRDSYERLLVIVEALDDKYAAVCKLKFFVGLNGPEIAEALGITEENVRTRLSRGRAMIRQQITQEGVHP